MLYLDKRLSGKVFLPVKLYSVSLNIAHTELSWVYVVKAELSIRCHPIACTVFLDACICIARIK